MITSPLCENVVMLWVRLTEEDDKTTIKIYNGRRKIIPL
jgi:hypothetical protein